MVWLPSPWKRNLDWRNASPIWPVSSNTGRRRIFRRTRYEKLEVWSRALSWRVVWKPTLGRYNLSIGTLWWRTIRLPWDYDSTISTRSMWDRTANKRRKSNSDLNTQRKHDVLFWEKKKLIDFDLSLTDIGSSVVKYDVSLIGLKLFAEGRLTLRRRNVFR